MVSYREATCDDLPYVCALGDQVNAVHHAAWPHIFAGAGVPERDREHWLQSIGRDTAATFVAEEGGQIIGFVTVGLVTESHTLLQPLRYARVGSIGVDASRRGGGIGSKLMAVAENWGIARGAQEMRLNVWAFNEAAMSMYAELGYEVRSHLLGKTLGG
jgi:ribosomal protein S18 acetylase RimI-like enzyme